MLRKYSLRIDMVGIPTFYINPLFLLDIRLPLTTRKEKAPMYFFSPFFLPDLSLPLTQKILLLLLLIIYDKIIMYVKLL